MTTATDILDYLNLKAGKKYRPGESHLKFINARLEEYTADELKAVIDAKCLDWLGNPDMAGYLSPDTLFNATKCAKYVGQLVSPDTQAVSAFNVHCKANGCPLRATNSRNRDRSGGLCTWHENSYPEQWPQITSRIIENRQLICGVLKFNAKSMVDKAATQPVEFCDIIPESTDPFEWIRQLEGVLHRRIRHDLKPVERQETRLGSLIANSGILGNNYQED